MDYIVEIKKALWGLDVNIPEQNELDIDIQSCGLNSIQYIQLVVELENLFGFEFPNDKLILTENNTIRKIADNIIKLKG